MKKYQCHKQVTAKPMTRLDFNIYRGWELPDDEDGSDDGYLVEYLDGGKSNHINHANYISWSPKDVFESGYTEITSDFPPTMYGTLRSNITYSEKAPPYDFGEGLEESIEQFENGEQMIEK